MLPGPCPWDPSYGSYTRCVAGTKQGPTQLPTIMQLKAQLLRALLLKAQTVKAALLEPEVPTGVPH